MKAYKGFDKNLKCRGFQYEIGKEYEEKEAIACKKGFHACENPLEVFNYYPPCNGSRYCEVEQSGEFSKLGNDSKVASTKIRIGDELGLKGIIQAGISFVLDKTEWNDGTAITTDDQSVATNIKDWSIAINTSHHSTATNIGDRSTTINTGFYSAATNAGGCSSAINIGHYSAAMNTGHHSATMNTGDQSIAVNLGGRSIATSTGNRSTATSIGYHSAAEVGGGESVAMVTGYKSKAKAGLGSAIVIAERGDWNGETYPLINIRAAIVDGEKIKADTWYTLINGEFVECN